MTPNDRFAHSNPAFGAASLCWVADGFQAEAGSRALERFLSPLWAMVSLALLTPDRVRERLAKSASGRLTNLTDDNPEWRLQLPLVVSSWSNPFWQALRFGIATQILDFSNGRIMTGSMSPKLPADPFARDLRKRATVL